MKHFLLSASLFFMFLIFSCQPKDSNLSEEDSSSTNIEETTESSDTIPYKMVTYTDTLSANPADPSAPTAKIAETWLVPQSNDEALNRLIFQSIAGQTVFEAGNLQLNGPEDAFQENKEWFFSDFKEVYEGFQELMGYDSETSMYADLNNGKWLTINISNFSYTGGAHGNYGTYYLTIDVKNRKRLTLEDVFKPGYESVLIPILEKKVREHFEMEPGTPLEEFLFENKIPVTENFGLMEDGILFDYPPYEIASYAAGEVPLLVKYEEINDILKEGITVE